MCLYPNLIKNRKYIANKKNGGVIPAITDKRVLLVPVGCGKCIECKKQKARSWQTRLTEDVRHNKNGLMVTLTFSDESIEKLSKEIKGLEGYDLDNEIATLGTRRFLERWRKKYKKSLRHWFVTELGHNGTENIHIHGIVWTDEERKNITNIWGYGFTFIGDNKGNGWVNEQTVNYIVKYVNKVDQDHKEYDGKILTSPGIGAKYMERQDSKKNKYNGEKTKETYKNRQGFEMNMPIYWRNKIYTEEEREKLWLQKLDKNERWVCGERVDVSTEKGEENYEKLVKYHRDRNKRMGYGNNEINWDRKQYERKRRILLQSERIKRVTEKRNEKVATPVIEVEGRTSTQSWDTIGLEKYSKIKKIDKNIW